MMYLIAGTLLMHAPAAVFAEDVLIEREDLTGGEVILPETAEAQTTLPNSVAEGQTVLPGMAEDGQMTLPGIAEDGQTSLPGTAVAEAQTMLPGTVAEESSVGASDFEESGEILSDDHLPDEGNGEAGPADDELTGGNPTDNDPAEDDLTEDELTDAESEEEDLPLVGASGTCGSGVNWSLENGALVISGSGAMTDFDYDTLPGWAKDDKTRESVRTVEIQEGVTRIGTHAFQDCSKITKVTMADTVVSIGDQAFDYCSSLSDLTLSAGLKQFGWGSFRFCEKLKKIVLPTSLTDMGEWTFEGCTGLKSVTIPYTVKKIGDGVFRGCESLSEVFMSDSITAVGRNAFRDCKALKRLTLPNTVRTLGDYAFHGAGLTEFAVPTGVTLIDYGTFFACYSLRKIELPYTLKEIRQGAFMECEALKEVDFTGTQEEWRKININWKNNEPLQAAKINYVTPPAEAVTPSVIYKMADEGSGFLRIYWRTIRGASGYQIRWSKDPEMKTGIRSGSYTGRNNAVRGDLDVGSTYYAQVRVFTLHEGERVYTRWSGIKNLTLTKSLETPVLKSVVIRDEKVRAVWETVPGVEGYQMRFADNASFGNAKTASAKGQKKTSYSRSGLAKGKTWYVQVRSFVSNEDGSRYYSKWSNPLNAYLP